MNSEAQRGADGSVIDRDIARLDLWNTEKETDLILSYHTYHDVRVRECDRIDGIKEMDVGVGMGWHGMVDGVDP